MTIKKTRFTKIFYAAVAGFAFLLLISCSASGSYILTGQARTPISANEVKLYLDAPVQYESIGVVEAVNTVGVKRQKSQNQLIKKLKEEAARLGANGILLTSTGSQTLITPASGESQSSSTSKELRAQGRAILVIKE